MWVDKLKEFIPDYAQDIKINLDQVINKSQRINPEDALHISIASAVSAGNLKLANFISQFSKNEIDKNAALSAGVIMAQSNAWYSYLEVLSDPEVKNLPAELRTQSVDYNGGTEKTKFRGYSLAASIIGKCQTCINTHANELKSMGYTAEQLRDIGRIAVTINAISKIFEESEL